MMTPKFHEHKVTLNAQRRENKKRSDIMSKGIPKQDMQKIFDSYYKDQVRALYRAIQQDK